MIAGSELVEAPHLAEVYARQSARPSWLREEPLHVNADLWAAARHELDTVLKERGWSVAMDEKLAKAGVDNFLLYGIPVVMA